MRDQASRSPRRSRAATFISRLLLGVGALLLLAAVGLQRYTDYAEMRWDREQAALSAQFVPAQPLSDVTPVFSPTPAPGATPTAFAADSPLATTVAVAERATHTPTPIPSPTPTPDDRSDPGRIIIPKLKVNAAIVVVPLLDGQWDASRLLYDVGLLAGTGWPGRSGNAAISGHVGLKGRGDGPFRWLEKLTANDEIDVEQGDVRYYYSVRQLRVVQPTDMSVVAPTEDATLTLITCTDWDFLKAEYTKRLIVTATLTGKRRIGAQSQ